MHSLCLRALATSNALWRDLAVAEGEGGSSSMVDPAMTFPVTAIPHDGAEQDTFQ